MSIYSQTSTPAILGGSPLFSERLGIVKPCLPAFDEVQEPIREILATGGLTNHSRYVREFEQALKLHLGVPFAQAVSNATLGLILTLAGLNLEGEVILPGFTFAATAHALHWNRLEPVFVDILPDTFTLDPVAVEAAITPRTCAILPVHIYGHPCEVDILAVMAEKYGLALVYDAAHAFGSCWHGQLVGGFGDAEVFSFHATKIFPVGEGGCVTTRKPQLAEYIGLARKFGDPGDENTRFAGLNAKMQEFNAILGLAGLNTIERHIANRNRYAAYLQHRLGFLAGISFQALRTGVVSNFQNFAILIDSDQFGLSRDGLFTALTAENIYARKYFSPPLHWHDTYVLDRTTELPVTERISSQVLCLPFYSEMSEDILDRICLAIERIYSHTRQKSGGKKDIFP